jgi:pimeloyl-ACP methyl ester carboxylesterase
MAPSTVRVTSADGVGLALHDLSRVDLGREGRPLLLSHATGFHGYVFGPLADELASDFHCWSLDYRGHGDSDDPPTDIGDWRRFGDDAVAAAEALELDGALGFGHSMGGAALLMAELARPGTFAGLVLFEPIAFPPDPDRTEGPTEMIDVARRRRTVFADREEAFGNYAGKPPLNLLTPAALHAYVDHGFVDRPDGTVELKCDPEHEARIFEGGAVQDLYLRLGGVGCPVLVLTGAPEGNPPGELGPVVAGALPQGRVVTLPQLSHFGPMQDPAAVATEIREFSRSLRTAA